MKKNEALELKKIIKKFRNITVLVVGDLMLDRYVWGKVSRISPEAPIPVVDVTKEDSKPGGAANVILNLVSLGAKVYAAGVIGNDEAGERLASYLRKEHVNISAVAADKIRPTTVKTRVIAHSQQVVRIDKEQKKAIPPKTAAEIVTKISKIIKKIDAVIFSDYNKGLLTRELVDGIMEAAGDRIVTVDPKPSNMQVFRNATLISPNKKEASEAAGMAINSEDDVFAASKILMDITGSKAVLITRGEEGMSLFKDETITTIPTVAREVFDVTGAGDTVISVVTLALSAGASIENACILSNIAAGRVVAEVGVVTLSPKQLEAAIDEK